jgi:hypothetical protein
MAMAVAMLEKAGTRPNLTRSGTERCATPKMASDRIPANVRGSRGELRRARGMWRFLSHFSVSISYLFSIESKFSCRRIFHLVHKMGNAQTGTAPAAQTPLEASVPSSATSASSVPRAEIAAAIASSASAPGGDKDEARLNRLRRSNSVKDRIYREWQKHCLKVCDDAVRDYWLCREDNGLMTPFKCQDTNANMHKCLQECGQDEVAYNTYKARRLDEIELEVMARLEKQEEMRAAVAAAAPPSTPSAPLK